MSYRLTKAQKEAQVMQALQRLNRYCPVGTTVYVQVRKVARSGASRTMSLYVVADGEIYNISIPAATLCGWPRVAGELAFRISGGGMDMTVEAVMRLSAHLHGTDHALLRAHL